MATAASRSARNCRKIASKTHPDYLDDGWLGENEIGFEAMFYHELMKLKVSKESLTFEYGDGNIDLAHCTKGIHNRAKNTKKKITLIEIKTIWKKGDFMGIREDIRHLIRARRREPNAKLAVIVPFISWK